MRATKRRKVISTGLPSSAAFPANGDSWDAEQDYERRPRKVRDKGDKSNDRLPVKTAEGWKFAEEDTRGAESDKDSVAVSSDGQQDTVDAEAETSEQPSRRQE